MRLVRLATIVGAMAALGSICVLPTDAAPAADDLSLRVQLGRAGNGIVDTKTSGLRFQILVLVDTASGVTQTVTVRIGLPDGLQWGTDAPDPGEGCIGTAPAVCSTGIVKNSAGTAGAGWYWDVVAAQPGTYEITASVEGEQADPNPTNNTATFRFEVALPSSGGGGGSGSGGASVAASAVKLSPTSPKAGSTVVASVRVARGGSPIRPSGVACSATAGKTKVKGGPKSASGVASCLFRTPAGAKGQTLAGSVSFTASGQRFTKRFSTKLR